MERPLHDVLYASTNAALNDTASTQPALFALGFALCELWKSWGVHPAAVIGHSVGEYVAACVAGVFSLKDGLRLISRRAQLMGTLPAGGAMAAVAAGVEAVQAAIAPYADEISIAAVNAPEQTVISGSVAAIESILTSLAAAGISGSRLRVSHAFHSPLIAPMLAEFERAAGEVRYRSPDLLFVSNVTGKPGGEDVATAGYWVRHAREPVRFAAGVEALYRRGCDVFIEAGPGRTLLGLGRCCVPDAKVLWLASLKPEGGDWQQLLRSLGQLYMRGCPVDWWVFDRDYARARVDLPTYPWQRTSHWLPARQSDRPPTSAEPESAAGRAFAPGDVARIERKLAASGEFSPDELKLMPRLLRALGKLPQLEAPDLRDDDLLYEVAWRPQAAATPALLADYWPRPRELAARMQPRLLELAPSYADAAYRHVLTQLESLSLDYVAEAWEQLGWSFGDRTRCHHAELVERLGVLDRHRRLLDRTAAMLVEAGLLRRDGEFWETAAPFESRQPSRQIGVLLAQNPAAAAECVLLDRCAGRLADVLRGSQDPLQLLFPDGDVTTATSLYRDSPGARLMNRVLHESVAHALEHLPPGRKLRVLEIGAGTGGTTTGLLEVLPPKRTEYFFTDISPRFTTAAQDQFGNHEFVRYRILDIERDPAAQGFAGEPPFDLIIAANVLHATKDLRQSLRHARGLAAPGAMLLLLEGTAPIRSVDLIFGLTEGWWRFADDEVRSAYPLISAVEWASVLDQSGFRDAEPLALANGRSDVLSRQAVILARAAQAETPANAPASRHWLILADRGGIGSRLASRHNAGGGIGTLVHPSQKFERVDEHTYRVAPDRPEDFHQLLASLDRARSYDVIHLWSLDEPAIDGTSDEPAVEAGVLSCGSVVSLVQSMLNGPAALPVGTKMWLVTQDAVGGEPPMPVAGLAQSGLWGLGRVIASEHPDLQAIRVDLDPAASADDRARVLWDELCSGAREDEVSFRAGTRYVSRLIRHATDKAVPVEFRGDASYLISGGLGGLGLLTARWMASRGAKTLVLAGRRAADEHAEGVCRELEGNGVRVVAYQADVARRPQVERLLDHIAKSLPPLRGIVHAAGVLDDGMVRQLNWERFTRVVEPKAAGAWNLHCLTLGMQLHFFVQYSSFTSIIGTAGQGNHAAANAFLDALAWYRRAIGLPALSIDWGAWSDIGAAAKRQVSERLTARGGGTLTPDQGLRLLEKTWHAKAAQIAIVPIYWAQLEARQMARPLLAELAAAAPAAASRPPDVLERLRFASPRQRRVFLLDHVLAETAQVLGMNGTDAIEPSQGFFELGMDSLTSVELRNRLAATLQCALPTTVAFDHPTPKALAQFVLAEIERTQAAAPARGPPTRPVAPRTAIDQAELSLAELENLIDELADPVS
jgi:microcystin synthetase protein McyG